MDAIELKTSLKENSNSDKTINHKKKTSCKNYNTKRLTESDFTDNEETSEDSEKETDSYSFK